MQSKFKLFAGFLLGVSFVVAAILAVSPVRAQTIAVTSDNECVANVCGTTMGTKQEAVYKEVCTWECPSVRFATSHEVVITPGHYADCPVGHHPVPGTNKCFRYRHGNDCNVDLSQFNMNGRFDCGKIFVEREWIPAVTRTETFGPILVQYIPNRGNANKCHRPNAASLNIPLWARPDYNQQIPEWKEKTQVCEQVFDYYDTVRCNDADIVPCAVCPTECGYEGGTVEDALGHVTRCPATNSCSTYRWCFPDEESSSGYIAEAVSVSISSETLEGMPWKAGMDEYCAYPEAGTCPTECGYAGGDEVADGSGGTILCQATAACEEPDEGDVLGVNTGTGDVLGTTSVVMAKTAAIDRSIVYFVESVLLFVTGFSFIYVGSQYLKRD